MRDPRRAYRVVDLFEQEICAYTGAPFAVAVNSCTNALFLALTWERMRGVEGPIRLPTMTYVGVLHSVLNAGFEVEWWEDQNDWWSWSSQGHFLRPSRVVDSARHLKRGLWTAADVKGLVCLSFHSAKQLPLGRGGAILTADEWAAEWFLAARMDGRPPGQPFSRTVFPAWHMPLPPDVAARGLDVLSRWNDAGWSPPPLPPTDYPDLSLIYPREGVKV